MAAPNFWNSTSLEPKRSHRWTLHLHGDDMPTFVIKKVDKPSFTINETEHNYFGHKFYYPGRVEWNTITVTLVDPINPDVSSAMFQALRKAGWDDPLTADGTLPTISKADSVAALGAAVHIRQYDSKGGQNKEIERWELYNPWIKEVKFGTLDYTSDEMLEIELTLRFDWAKLEV